MGRLAQKGLDKALGLAVGSLYLDSRLGGFEQKHVPDSFQRVMLYAQFCANRLFAPLNLRSPIFGDSRTIVRQRATTYPPFRYGGTRPGPMDHLEVLKDEAPAMTYPGGGLNISIADFAQWLAALLDGKILLEG